MSKNNRNRFRQKNVPIGNFSIDDQELPFTNDPGTRSATTGNWKSDTATTAAVAASEDDDEVPIYQPAPNNWPSFTTDVLRGQISINKTILLLLLIVWFGVNTWMLIQDNGGKLLQSYDGWVMYGNKVGATTILFVITSLIVIIPSFFKSVVRWIKKSWAKNKSKNK